MDAVVFLFGNPLLGPDVGVVVGHAGHGHHPSRIHLHGYGVAGQGVFAQSGILQLLRFPALHIVQLLDNGVFRRQLHILFEGEIQIMPLVGRSNGHLPDNLGAGIDGIGFAAVFAPQLVLVQELKPVEAHKLLVQILPRVILVKVQIGLGLVAGGGKGAQIPYQL
ncbi:hypothetical protein D3C75_947040 [compost metagenome]